MTLTRRRGGKTRPGSSGHEGCGANRGASPHRDGDAEIASDRVTVEYLCITLG